jgi:hypothetical protein
MPVDRRGNVQVVVHVDNDFIALVRFDQGTGELVVDGIDLAGESIGCGGGFVDVKGVLPGGLRSALVPSHSCKVPCSRQPRQTVEPGTIEIM